MTQRYIHNSRINTAFMRFLIWRERHISERKFVIFLALLVGVFGGLAAQLLKYLIHTISGVLTSHIDIHSGNYLYILLPTLGVVSTDLYVFYVVRDNISHVATRVL